MKIFGSILILLAIGLIIYVIYLIIHCKRTNRILLDYFKENSVIVFGAKGKGKDLLFQKIIYLKKDKPYISNIDYGYKSQIEPLNTLSIAPNTYEMFIENKIINIDKNSEYEGKDYYISDAGNFLPAQYYDKLNKKYPSLPLYYSLSRHLYNMNIHMNSQSLRRAWNLLREQADKFIKCEGKIKIFGGMLCKIRFYDKYESADRNLLPMQKPGLFDKIGRAEYNQYNATNGEILTRRYFIKIKHIKYDTRAFHKIIFGKTFQEWEKEQNTENVENSVEK